MTSFNAMHVRAVVRKELRDYRRKRSIVVTMGILPALFLLQPVLSVFLATPGTTPAAQQSGLILPILYLLLIPAIMPSTLAAYTVVGEREQGTLEPLLTTPLRQQEFLLGKAASVMIPTLLLSYTVFGLFLFAVWLGAHSAVASAVFHDGPVILALFLLSPLMAAWGIAVGMAMSVRATEVRVAQQLGMLASPSTPPAQGGMTGIDAIETAENYRRFAQIEAAGRSSAYETLALAVADDEAILAFLEGMPPIKRQPNLLFAAARFLLGEPPDPESLRELVVVRPQVLREVMCSRRTQTNEAARCAVLLPAFALVDGPLALLEVGAAAGLTLLPDVYSYDYEGHVVRGLDPEAPILRCRPVGPVPLPGRVPHVVWRAGLDLNPLDVTDDDDVAWLSCLVWPGEADRAQRLDQAVAAARRHPPVVHRGDLLDDLGALAATAPFDATLVVYHSAVLAYVGEDTRRAFAEAVATLGGVWLSNEGDRVLDCIGVSGTDPGSFILVRDGHEVLARCDPHGTWIEWLQGRPERTVAVVRAATSTAGGAAPARPSRDPSG